MRKLLTACLLAVSCGQESPPQPEQPPESPIMLYCSQELKQGWTPEETAINCPAPFSKVFSQEWKQAEIWRYGSGHQMFFLTFYGGTLFTWGQAYEVVVVK